MALTQTQDSHGFFIWLAIALRYRLTTVLLLVAIVAISLGWFVDHFYRSRTEIIGTWYYNHGGYRTTLTIRPDKTFSKIQSGRSNRVTYDGTYSTHDNGVIFQIAKKTESVFTQNGIKDLDTTELNEPFPCRYAIDKAGYLLIDDHGLSHIKKEIGIRWETFRPEVAR